MKIFWKLCGILNGDYFKFRKAAERAGDYELPYSMDAWSEAERLRIKYGWKRWSGYEEWSRFDV